MSVVDSVLTRVPRSYRDLAVRHRELIKFAAVGAVTFFIDTALFYVLKLTVLEPKPVTAKVIAVLVATIVSYVLNREWSFRTRGGRERHHEAALYFVVSGVGVALYAAPLWISRYAFHLCTPFTSRLVEEISDFTAGQIIGLLAGMAFRWWAFRKWVFPGDDEFPETDDRAEDRDLSVRGNSGNSAQIGTWTNGDRTTRRSERPRAAKPVRDASMPRCSRRIAHAPHEPAATLS